MTKFENKSFTPSQSVAREEVKEAKPFQRDESDNKLFPEIQVKDPIKRCLITKDTIGVWDFDTPVYRIAQQMENKYLEVICKKDKTIKADLKNKTEFKGRTKKVSDNSWLGLLNIERGVKGLEPLEVEDFELTEKQELKYEEDKAMEQAKILVYKKLKQVRQQFQLPRIILALGEGLNFRNCLPTVRPYKGNRKETIRPLLLKKLRQWCREELGAVMAEPRYDGQMVECDDFLEYKKAEGYKTYRKNGWISYVCISSDKDSTNSAGAVINPDLHSGDDNPLKGKFKFPQMMLIEATDRCAGNLELVTTTGSSDVKGYGFKFLMYQAALGLDGADFYDALGHLKDAGYDLNFGTQSAYKVLQPCKTAKETLQETINTFAKLLPYGVEYYDHKGDKHDVDTLTYMNTYFLVAYMTRSSNDKMDFFKLCKAFKVDTSKVENNNLLTAPYKVFNIDVSEELIGEVLAQTQHVIDNQMRAYKSLKKDEVVGRMDKSKEVLQKGVIDYIKNNMFKTVQRNKITGEILEVIDE